MSVYERIKAWNERNKRPWQRRLEARSNHAFDRMDKFAKSGKLERVGKKFDNAGNSMIRGGITMAFWPIVVIWRAFNKKSSPPEAKQK